MPDSIKAIMLAPEVLAVDQDSLGAQAVKVRDDGTTEVLSKPLSGGAVRAKAGKEMRTMRLAAAP